ncbi:MAG TPA: hypothetical protein DCY12_06010 [Candidatus Atribacteria bacterium]|nr:hypothetical protein [Candidatus Atribacteria bacterium]
MVFSDTTNYNGLIQNCEFICNLGATGISGNTALLKDFTRNINNRYDQIISIILESMDGWDWDDSNQTDYPIATANLVANQQDYTFPTTLLKIKRVEVSYDGTEWHEVTPFDISQRSRPTDTTSIADDFTATEPYYDIVGSAVFLYPIPASNVTSGLKIWYFREKDAFTTTDTTQKAGFDSVFHPMLAVGASLDWAIVFNPDLSKRLVEEWFSWEGRLRKYYGKKALDTNYQFNSVVSTEDYE